MTTITAPEIAPGYTLTAFTEQMQRFANSNYPGLWEMCYPHTCSEPSASCGKYYSTKSLAAQQVSNAESIHRMSEAGQDPFANSGIVAELLVASRLVQFVVPHFWIARDILEACLHTSPSEAIDWNELPMPFEAVKFMVPKGSLMRADGVDCISIGFARIRKGDHCTTPFF